jgi:hypothetical protein
VGFLGVLAKTPKKWQRKTIALFWSKSHNCTSKNAKNAIFLKNEKKSKKDIQKESFFFASLPNSVL